jgi:hypothetical protein
LDLRLLDLRLLDLRLLDLRLLDLRLLDLRFLDLRLKLSLGLRIIPKPFLVIFNTGLSIVLAATRAVLLTREIAFLNLFIIVLCFFERECLRVFAIIYYINIFFKSICTLRELNPGLKNGSLKCYHYTKGAYVLLRNCFLFIDISGEGELNTRPIDLQSTALPTELSPATLLFAL